MLKLLILRDRLRAFYGKYSSVLIALLRFSLAFSARAAGVFACL